MVKELKKKENKKIYLIKFYGQNLKDWRKDGNFSKLYSADQVNMVRLLGIISRNRFVNYLVGKPDSLFAAM